MNYKKINRTTYIIGGALLFSMMNLVPLNIVLAKAPKGQPHFITTTLNRDEVKTKLSSLIKEPFDVEVNVANITVNFHEVIITADDYLKNKLFSIASFLLTNEMAPAVIITSWKDLDSNYAYKAAIVKDDLEAYNKGQIDYKTLFSKIKIAKSQLQELSDSLDDNLEKTKLQLSPTESLVSSDTKPVIKPDIPPETFYTPILKPIIKEDFYVIASENVVSITIQSSPDSENATIRDKAYEIIRRIMGVNPSLSKIDVSWQTEQEGYGKSASLAGIYIKDFFRKKMQPYEVKEVILISSIEPRSRKLNKVSPVARMDVPVENLRKAMKLREAANVYRLNKKNDSAIRTYKRAIKYNPNDYLSYYWLGELYMDQNEFDKAEDFLNKSVGLNPEFRKADETLSKLKSK
jgi:tetratricopeptide (TPR) repeat protein